MDLKKLSFNQRRVQVTALTVFLLLYYLFHYRSSSSSSKTPFTNEEINSILSGEDLGSDIVRVPISSQSLHPPYLNQDLGIDGWEIVGDSLVKNTEYVRLTTENKDQHGLISNKHSFNSDGFEIEIKMKIHGNAKLNQLKGDGFALFLTSSPQDTIGPVFGALDYFDGLGVFFDTYRNAPRGPVFPYIVAMNGDGQTAYDKDEDGKANELGGCSARGIYNPKQGYTKVRMIHTVEDGYLSLDFNVDGQWENCFSIKDVHIPKERFLSFSAATGQLVENVDLMDVDVWELKQFDETITSWRDFIEHIDEEEEDPDTYVDHKGRTIKRKSYRKRRNPKQRAKLRAKVRNKELRKQAFNKGKREEDEKPSFLRTLWNLFKIVIAILLLLVAFYVGFTIYRVKKKTWRSQRKTIGLLD